MTENTRAEETGTEFCIHLLSANASPADGHSADGFTEGTRQAENFIIQRIALEGAPNTRDLGGMPAADGRRIRGKKLLRSGDLHDLTEKDEITLINEYHVKKVLDFRTEAERRERPDRSMEGVSYAAIPILDETTLGITREKQSDRDALAHMLDEFAAHGVRAAAAYMEKLYSGFLAQEFARKEYRLFFEELLAGSDGAILWHCTAGKDRVGIGTMLLLEALGVDRSLIFKDYLKVNEFSEGVVFMQSKIAAERTGRKEAGEIVKKLFSVEPSYLEAVYNEIERDFGSVDRFLCQEMGLDADRRELLRKTYLE